MRESDSSLHRRWRAMKSRCNNPKASNYKNYGAKGVKVCPEWEDSFQSFKTWALANGYSEELMLERSNGSLGYGPNNCMWASRTIQNSNRGKFQSSKREFIGVHLTNGRYQARVQVNKKRVHIGMYDSEEAAASARDLYIKANNLPHQTNR